MAPGAGSKFGARMFEPEVFRKQMCCIEESTCDIAGNFRRPPQSFGVRRIAPPLPPLVTPLLISQNKTNEITTFPWRELHFHQIMPGLQIC